MIKNAFESKAKFICSKRNERNTLAWHFLNERERETAYRPEISRPLGKCTEQSDGESRFGWRLHLYIPDCTSIRTLSTVHIRMYTFNCRDDEVDFPIYNVHCDSPCISSNCLPIDVLPLDLHDARAVLVEHATGSYAARCVCFL